MPSGGWTGPICLTINRRSLDLIRGGAQVAQLVEHATENRSVGGSIPPLGTKILFLLSCPQHDAKQRLLTFAEWRNPRMDVVVAGYSDSSSD